jgi:hypothetical protein
VRAFLAKFSPQKAMGVYVGDHEITLSKVAGTPFGPVRLSCTKVAYQSEALGHALRQLLESAIGKKRAGAVPVAVGMPALRVFFSTRPIRTTDTEASPQVLLHEVLQSPNICIDDMVVEVIKAQPGKRKLASIVSCRKKYLSGLLEALDGFGIHPFRLEPAPCALLRAAVRAQRTPGRSKTLLRIILGESQGISIVTAGELLVMWRFFNLAPGQESEAICSAYRAMQALIVHCGIEAPIDAVMLHGRGDLRDKFSEVREKIEPRLTWSDQPGLDDNAIAFGLAIGCLGLQTQEAFDLSRSAKPLPSLSDIFPWGELAFQFVLIVCMGVILFLHSRALNESYTAIQLEVAKRTWQADLSEAQLEKEKKDLDQKVEAMRKFLGNRIIWTSYTHDLAYRLPANATLNAFYGLCELEATGKQAQIIKPKKQFVIKAASPITKNGRTPEEVDAFLTALRGDPLLQHDFPLIELADIKWFQPNLRDQPIAVFTVICLPGLDGSAPAGGAKGNARGG